MWRALCRTGGVAALLVTFPVLRPAAQPVASAPLATGGVTFLLHSTIIGHFTGQAPVARAEFTGGRLADVRGMAEVLVAQMLTGNGLRDRHMRETMRADSFPTIHFDLDSVQAGTGAGTGAGDTTSVVLVGRLAIHGVTRLVRVNGTVVTRPGGEDVDASFGLDMRDYGLKPPVRAVVLHVAPDVVVTVHLSFGHPPS